MFTGLIRELGSVDTLDMDAGKLAICMQLHCDLGASIAVNGCCLTVASQRSDIAQFDVMPQTFSLTNLGTLTRGTRVNLEPALSVGDAMGGHIVQGHVDGVGVVTAVRPDGNAIRVWISLPEELARYVVEHGSIAVNGVSLTVAQLTEDAFCVSLIPETCERTTFGEVQPGTRVNLEVDVLARYVERLVAKAKPVH